MASNVSLATGGGCTVSAQMDADFYASVFGEDPVVLQIGSKCEPTIGSATTVNVADGVFLVQGRQIHITEDTFNIPSGSAATYYCGYEIYTESGKEKVRQFVKTYIPTNAALLRDNAENAYGTLLIVKTSTTAITLAAKIAAPVARASTSLITTSGSMNNFIESGRYCLYGTQTEAPSGIKGNGWLDVEAYAVRNNGDLYAWQTFYPWTDGSKQPVYNRMYKNGVWGSWAGGNYAAGTNISINNNTISATPYTAADGTIQISSNKIKASFCGIGSSASGKGTVPANGSLFCSCTVPENVKFLSIRVDSPYVMGTNGWIDNTKHLAYVSLVNWSNNPIETWFTCFYYKTQ